MQLRETTSRTHKGNVPRLKKTLKESPEWLQKDEVIRSGCGWFRFRSMRRSRRTVFLQNQETRTPGSSWHKPPPKGFGCLWARR